MIIVALAQMKKICSRDLTLLQSKMPRGKALSVDLRKAIIAASSQAKSTYTISKEFNLPRSTVQDIVSLNKKTGSVEIRKKPGRTLLTTRAERRILKKNC